MKTRVFTLLLISCTRSSTADPPRAASGGQAERSPAARSLGAARSDNPGGATLATCEALCAMLDPLKCRNGRECGPRCRSMLQIRGCAREMQKVLGCLSKQPLENWECDDDGIGAVRDPYCSDEQAMVVGCLAKGEPIEITRQSENGGDRP